MKKKSTKKALLSSALALVLCLAMLAGTTFAWFTDSVTSANNFITSGNLDVELYYQVEGQTDWTKVTETTNVFMQNALWEPGHTEVVKLKVVNAGSLALKYNLGVNVASEVGSVNASGAEFLLSDFIKFAVIDGANTYTRDEAVAAAEGAGATALKAAYNSGTTQLLSTEEDFVTMVVYMPTEVGNDANPAKGAATPTINLGINLFATQATHEEDAFDELYDEGAIIATNAAEAQAALDNAKPGAMIKLVSGVNYGKLSFRANPGHSNTTLEDIADAWRYNYNRTIENITIVGAEGAVVDAIVFETGAQPGDCNNRATVKNLVIDGVEFTATLAASSAGYNGSVFITTSNATVDGLTVKNCKLIGDNSKLNLVYLYGADGAKNVTLSGNTVDGVARLCELRGTENVTITNNTIKNTYEHGMLLAGANYSGNVTITGNTASGINNRFVRMAGAGDAAVVIKDNTINNYLGADDDFIKVTDGTNVTVENNALVSVGVKDAAAAQKVLDNAAAGTTIQLQPGVNYGTLYLRPVAGSAATREVDWIGNNYHYETYSLFEDLTIIGAPGAIVDVIKIEGGTYYNSAHSQSDTYPVMLSLIELKNVVIDGVTFTGNGGQYGDSHGNAISLAGNNIKVDGLTIKNCVLEDSTNNNRLLYKSESTTHVHTYEYDGVTYTFTPSLKDITVTGCTFNGGYMGLELRETENVTITNNEFNVGDRNILLTANSGCTFTGNVTITGNVSNNAKQRFVRADAMGDAVVVVANNTINNYMASDADYIKVTNANNVTVENNTKN